MKWNNFFDLNKLICSDYLPLFDKYPLPLLPSQLAVTRPCEQRIFLLLVGQYQVTFPIMTVLINAPL